MSYFDNLIRDGRDADAMRHFARTYYDNGKIGHTRMTLLVRVADEHDALKTENAKLRKVVEAADKFLSARNKEAGDKAAVELIQALAAYEEGER